MHSNTNKDYWNLFLSSLAVFLSTFYIIFWSFHVIALIYGKYKFGSKRSIKNKVVDKFDDLPGVTILKPLKGVDDNLMENLTTFFNIDYPYYELIFCIQDENDPAIDVVKRLMAKYPIIDTKLFYGGKIVCANPKISNLSQGYPHAKYNYILISDSGIKTTKDALYDMVCLMNKDVGLVHQMPYCCDRPGKMSNLLEKIYFGTWQARNYLFINFFGLNCVVGMSCLMRKSVIDECGGLIHFGKYIAEDFFLAQAFIDRKYKTPMSHEPAWQNSALYSPAIWRARVIRWTQLRVRLSVPSWIEPFAECFLQGLYGAWCLYYFTSNLNYCTVFYFLHVMIWYLLDYVQLLIIENGEFKYSIFKCFPVWLYRETISYWIFFRGVMSRKVKWRSGTYKLKFGGHGVRVETNKPSTSSRLCFWKPRERLGSNSTISIASYSQKEIKPPAMQQRFVGASENSSNKISSII